MAVVPVVEEAGDAAEVTEVLGHSRPLVALHALARAIHEDALQEGREAVVENLILASSVCRCEGVVRRAQLVAHCESATTWLSTEQNPELG